MCPSSLADGFGLGVVLLCAAAVTVMYLGGALSNEQRFTNDPESARATALVGESFPGNDRSREIVIVRSGSLTVDDPEFRDQVQAVTVAVMGLGSSVVESGIDYTTDASPVLVSADGHAALSLFTLGSSAEGSMDNAEALAAAAKGVATQGTTAQGAAVGPDFEVLVTGEASINSDFGATAASDLRTGEIFGIGIALVILVLVFGAIVTASVPDHGAGLYPAGHGYHRGGRAVHGSVLLHHQHDHHDRSGHGHRLLAFRCLPLSGRTGGRSGEIYAIARTGSTASRSVLFSAVAVILALGGLFLVPSTLFHSMAMGAIIAVFTALLGRLDPAARAPRSTGDRVNALRVPFLHRTGSNAATGAPDGVGGGAGAGAAGVANAVGGIGNRPVAAVPADSGTG